MIVLGMMAPPQDARAQQPRQPGCMSAAPADTGAVEAIGALAADEVLVAGAKGLFRVRAAGGNVTAAALAGVTGTGRVFALQELPGGRLLVGAESGLFLGRLAKDRLALDRAGDVGRVVQMHAYPGDGALIEAANGWFVVRTEGARTTLLPIVTAAPVTPDNVGRIRSIRSVPGGGALVEATVWLAAREEAGRVTLALAGDAATGVIDAIGDGADGQLLVHTQQNEWFWGTAANGVLSVKPAGAAETGRVFQMKRLGSGMLVWARNGFFAARDRGGRIALTPVAGVETGQAFQLREFGNGLLISAERGLFHAREQDGEIVIASVGDAAIGPALSDGIHALPSGGMLIGASRGGWFVADGQGSNITLTPRDNIATGRIAQMHELGGALLIGAEAGLFVAGPGCSGK